MGGLGDDFSGLHPARKESSRSGNRKLSKNRLSTTSSKAKVRERPCQHSMLKRKPNSPSSPTGYQTHGRRIRTECSRIRLSVRHPGCPCRHNPDIGLSATPHLGDFHTGCPASKKSVGHPATTVGRLYSPLGEQDNDAPHNPEWPHGS